MRLAQQQPMNLQPQRQRSNNRKIFSFSKKLWATNIIVLRCKNYNSASSLVRFEKMFLYNEKCPYNAGIVFVN
jgi:hypothetical protein